MLPLKSTFPCLRPLSRACSLGPVSSTDSDHVYCFHGWNPELRQCSLPNFILTQNNFRAVPLSLDPPARHMTTRQSTVPQASPQDAMLPVDHTLKDFLEHSHTGVVYIQSHGAPQL